MSNSAPLEQASDETSGVILALAEEDAYLRRRSESRRMRRPTRDLAEAIILADDLPRTKGLPPSPRLPPERP